MMIVSMSTFRVFGWDGLHARACYLWLRPVRVSPTLSTALVTEPSARRRALVLEVSVSRQRAGCFLHVTFCLIDVLVW